MITDSLQVSVIIPSKNRLDFVQKAIESVMVQTYRSFEIIVVDDGSTIPLARLLSEKYGDGVICLRQEQSRGAPAARNAGAKQAKGKFIAFLDDDDFWFPEKLEKQVNIFIANDAVGLVFCGESLVCEGEIVKENCAVWNSKSIKELLVRNVIGGTSTVLMKKSLFFEELFDEQLPACQDWDLFLRLSMKVEIRAVPDILVSRVIHGPQISSILENRIAGRALFYEKHKETINGYPIALSQHYRRMGSLLAINNEYSRAQGAFQMALKSRPQDWRNWACVFVSYFFPSKMAAKILSRYAMTCIGSYCQFH